MALLKDRIHKMSKKGRKLAIKRHLAKHMEQYKGKIMTVEKIKEIETAAINALLEIMPEGDTHESK